MANKIPCGGFNLGTGLFMIEDYLNVAVPPYQYGIVSFYVIDTSEGQIVYGATVSDNNGNHYIDTDTAEGVKELKTYLQNDNYDIIVQAYDDRTVEGTEMIACGNIYVPEPMSAPFNMVNVQDGAMGKDLYVLKRVTAMSDPNFVELTKIGTLS